MNRRPPTGARQPKDTERKPRVHIAISAAWLATIEKAARKRNLGRSNFIVTAAYEAAQRELSKKAPA